MGSSYEINHRKLSSPETVSLTVIKDVQVIQVYRYTLIRSNIANGVTKARIFLRMGQNTALRGIRGERRERERETDAHLVRVTMAKLFEQRKLVSADAVLGALDRFLNPIHIRRLELKDLDPRAHPHHAVCGRHHYAKNRLYVLP